MDSVQSMNSEQPVVNNQPPALDGHMSVYRQCLVVVPIGWSWALSVDCPQPVSNGQFFVCALEQFCHYRSGCTFFFLESGRALGEKLGHREHFASHPLYMYSIALVLRLPLAAQGVVVVARSMI